MYALQKIVEFFGSLANHVCDQHGFKRYFYIALLINIFPVWLFSVSILFRELEEALVPFIMATTPVMIGLITTLFTVTARLLMQWEEEKFKKGLPKMLRSGKFYKTPFKWW